MTDIQILQGTDSGYSWPLLTPAGTPMVLTGYSVKSQVRSMKGELLHTWSTALGNAPIVGNVVYVLWTAAQTSSWRWSTARYDVEIISPQNTVARIDSGFINLSKETTL